ncbi:hypothetical protein N7468_008854 [Penicillium chermesinum]|uniref:Uncharacterized protein n=1 Tax=Penicillium chermesinum TaxID=63820 RepID=A0A9W9TFJ7_9EURO|nr:uncharacterized protein N7468_008854 [Penicillium chermesinum]KAJ5219650.1 hypothetical protein N7468_008854 [Penicillium chermesinum]KAJ6153655.1 hypothetical protein N7470_006614 [Penicillium chermesinum]
MPSFTLRAVVAATVLLASTSTAFPLFKREPQWSFDLFSTAACSETGDLYAGSGSTGCRADLNNEAAAYRLNTLSAGCTIEFYDNTMCDENFASGVAGPISVNESADTCRIPRSEQRFGSYQVTCRDATELK